MFLAHAFDFDFTLFLHMIRARATIASSKTPSPTKHSHPYTLHIIIIIYTHSIYNTVVSIKQSNTLFSLPKSLQFYLHYIIIPFSRKGSCTACTQFASSAPYYEQGNLDVFQCSLNSHKSCFRIYLLLRFLPSQEKRHHAGRKCHLQH